MQLKIFDDATSLARAAAEQAAASIQKAIRSGASQGTGGEVVSRRRNSALCSGVDFKGAPECDDLPRPELVVIVDSRFEKGMSVDRVVICVGRNCYGQLDDELT